MLGFSKKTRQAEFWKWFSKNEDLLFEFEQERDRIFDLLEEALHQVHEDLTFEFSSKHEGKRDLVISAGGIKAGFPAVVALTQAAPKLTRWNLIAFRPRRGIGNEIKYEERRIHSDNIEFSLIENGTLAGIHLFLPGYREEDTEAKIIGYLMLDNALGEFDVETRLGPIRFFASDAQIEGDRYPLRELPDLFDRLIARLEERSGKPS